MIRNNTADQIMLRVGTTALLLSTLAIGQAVGTWKQNPSTGRWYAVGIATSSWMSGEALANNYGGHLATIRNSAEQAWIESAFASELGGSGLWIGYNDIATEGQWVWSSGEPTTYTNWSPGQPDNGSSTPENAAHFWGTSFPASQWRWNDETESVSSQYRPLIEGIPPTTASSTVYGTGCGNPLLIFVPNSNPVIGSTLTALIAGSPTALAAVTIGVSDSISFPFLLPLELTPFGMPGCYLRQSSELFGLPVTPAPPNLLFSTTVPANNNLVGQRFYAQSYAYAPGQNAAEAITSNGIAWTIGNQ